MCPVILCESSVAATRKKKWSEFGNPFAMFIVACFPLTEEKQHLGNFLTLSSVAEGTEYKVVKLAL